MAFTAADRQILRELAKHQLELANTPKNRALEKEWADLNNFRASRPMIHLELWTFEEDVLPPLLKCAEPAAREVERRLWRHFANQELLGDDRVVPDHFPVRWKTWFHLFGHEPGTTHATDTTGGDLGHSFNTIVDDLEEDYEKLGPSTWGVDREASLAEEEMLRELLGDILPVKRVMDCLYAVPTQKLVHLMGMENMLFAICDYPELFLTMMDRVAADYNAYYKWLETEGLLLPTVGAENLGQGTYCYTDELPASGPLTTRDVWGFMDSQESVGISPEMFGEFIFPCYKAIAGSFGLLSYGCCEPVHPVWDEYVGRLENLRKVSISPWCDEAFMGERLRGKRVVYQRKPSPNYLGVGDTLDEHALREHIRITVEAAKGCTLEFTQRDVYTIGGSVPKARRYVEILRETIASHWQG